MIKKHKVFMYSVFLLLIINLSKFLHSEAIIIDSTGVRNFNSIKNKAPIDTTIDSPKNSMPVSRILVPNNFNKENININKKNNVIKKKKSSSSQLISNKEGKKLEKKLLKKIDKPLAIKNVIEKKKEIFPEDIVQEEKQNSNRKKKNNSKNQKNIEKKELIISFEKEKSELLEEHEALLNSFFNSLSDEVRITIVAYASSIDNNTSKARRLSLSRALSVRAAFIKLGLINTRIDVKAMGNDSSLGKERDKVKVLITN